MDVAALSLAVDSSDVVKATADLDRFAASATKAGAAAGNQNGSIARLVASVQSTNAKLTALIGAVEKLTSSQNGAAAAARNMASANDNVSRALGMADAHVVAYTQHLAGLARSQGDANAHVLAYRNHLKNVGDTADKTTTAIKFTAREGLNASRQLADIGVTAAMGMNPLLIALQQGPQLFDILQEKAVATGSTISATFRAAAAAVWAAIAPLLAVILPIVAAIGLLVAGVAALIRQANDDSGLKKYTTAMGYTKAEVEKLNAVTVTMGDTAKAVFQVGWSRIADAFGISTDEMSKKWQGFLDWLATATRATLAGIYAGILGTEDLKRNLINDTLSGDLGLDTITKGYKERYAQAQRFFDDVAKQGGANARKRQDEMAKGFYDAPSGGSKSDPLGDILRAAQAEVKAEQSRAAAAGLSARAAAELEQKTKLLNQIEKAKIPVTNALREKVEGLAKAYADAKMAADIAFAVQGVTDGLQKQNDAINDQLALVGLYGDELTAVRIELEALAKARDALPKGEELSPEQRSAIRNAVQPVIRDQINLDQTARLEAIRKDAEDSAYALELEQKALLLTGKAALEYAFIAEKLNAAKRAGIELSPAEVAAIEAAGKAYAQQRYAIDQSARAIADAREVTRGFLSDWINGMRQSGNVVKSFADAAVNALNRIIDKLLDRALDSFLDGLFKQGSGGGGGGGGDWLTSAANFLSSILKNANGNAFGTPQRFANGGAFTNTIVNTPTLFRYANGAAIGEMGEAGPEAIMPLSRGPNGKLGVQAHGGGGRPVAHITIQQDISLAGAMMPETVIGVAQQAAAAAVMETKRNLEVWLREIDVDGTIST